MVFVVHIWGYEYQKCVVSHKFQGIEVQGKRRNYTRTVLPAKIDFSDSAYAAHAWLYIFCGLLDAMWQTFVYWLLGAMSNDLSKLAVFTGFCESSWSFVPSELEPSVHRQRAAICRCCWCVACGCCRVTVSVLPLGGWDTTNTRPPQLHEYIYLYMGFVRCGGDFRSSDDPLPYQRSYRRGRYRIVRTSLLVCPMTSFDSATP